MLFIPLSKFFNLVAKLLCLSSASSNDKYPVNHVNLLKKDLVINIYQNYKLSMT